MLGEQLLRRGTIVELLSDIWSSIFYSFSSSLLMEGSQVWTLCPKGGGLKRACSWKVPHEVSRWMFYKGLTCSVTPMHWFGGAMGSRCSIFSCRVEFTYAVMSYRKPEGKGGFLLAFTFNLRSFTTCLSRSVFMSSSMFDSDIQRKNINYSLFLRDVFSGFSKGRWKDGLLVSWHQ